MAGKREKRHSDGALTAKKLDRLTDTSVSVLAERVRHFVPQSVLQRLEDGPKVECAEISRVNGAVGFFDISGFTKLGNDLAHKQTEEKEHFQAKARGTRSSFGRIGDRTGSANFATASLTAQGTGEETLTSQLNGMLREESSPLTFTIHGL